MTKSSGLEISEPTEKRLSDKKRTPLVRLQQRVKERRISVSKELAKNRAEEDRLRRVEPVE